MIYVGAIVAGLCFLGALWARLGMEADRREEWRRARLAHKRWHSRGVWNNKKARTR